MHRQAKFLTVLLKMGKQPGDHNRNPQVLIPDLPQYLKKGFSVVKENYTNLNPLADLG
jgi:hypothetical protein